MSADASRVTTVKVTTSPHRWARPVGRFLSGILILAAALSGYSIYRLYFAVNTRSKVHQRAEVKIHQFERSMA